MRRPLTLEAGAVCDVSATLEVLLAGGERKRLDDTERRALLERVRAGEHVEVAFRARTFEQSDKPNRNHIRFKPSILGKLARSFVGQPFLRDHGQSTLEDRGGTITGAELVKGVDDTAGIEMTIRAVKPWAVTGLLDGTIDRFSIGWHPTAPIVCSVHKGLLRGPESCGCYPGAKSGGQTVEAIFTGADGVEVSAVNVPAVPEARGIEFLAELSAWSCEATRDNAQGDRMIKIATMLGMASGASEDDLAAALAKLQSSHATLEVRLTAAEERRTMVESKLAELTTAAEVAAKAALAQRVSADIERLYATGRLAVTRDAHGTRTPHAFEPALRAMVDAVGYDGFKAYADSLPVLSPIGAPMQLTPGAATSPAPEHPALMSPGVLATMKAAGISIDDVKKHNGLGMLAEGGAQP